MIPFSKISPNIVLFIHLQSFQEVLKRMLFTLFRSHHCEGSTKVSTLLLLLYSLISLPSFWIYENTSIQSILTDLILSPNSNFPSTICQYLRNCWRTTSYTFAHWGTPWNAAPPLHCILDLEKAFDHAPHKLIWYAFQQDLVRSWAGLNSLIAIWRVKFEGWKIYQNHLSYLCVFIKDALSPQPSLSLLWTLLGTITGNDLPRTEPYKYIGSMLLANGEQRYEIASRWL